MSLNPDVAPSGNFSLSDWKITLPVDSSGKTSGEALEVSDLSGYQNGKYFHTGSDGAMVFYAPVDGATTSGSSYARSELREMNGTAKAEWSLKTGGFMSATLEVDAAPMRDGEGRKVVIGQIHGQDDELVRLYWHDNTLYFANDQSGADSKEHDFTFKADDGTTPNVSLNEKFSYTIHAKGSVLDVDIHADGKVYHSHSTINAVWQSDSFYFKAGAYLGANESNGSGYGQTSFYALSFNHDGKVTTPSTPSTPGPAPEPTPKPNPDAPTPGRPATTKTIEGSNGNNYVKGASGNELLKGNAGRDVLWGKAGSDVLTGGSHEDAFVFDTAIGKDVDYITDFNVKDDSIRLDNAIFRKLTKTGSLSSSVVTIGEKAKDSNDYIVYNNKTGALSYDADGSGEGAAVRFAVIENKMALTAADFFVI
ncbi:polysaccharide lyase family 7 protein [Microvirga sp. M2]|uniref:polysaccharide lyase family 7 protein n=1 Tax=Microvirga sp. M2 TaxID=3073270 RepID=UPI0039C20C48